MLNKDDLINGVPFILKLPNASRQTSYWVETLRGDMARHWFDIYQRSDWQMLRAEGGCVFRNRVTEEQVQTLRNSRRCIVLHTLGVMAEDIKLPAAPPREPGWENEGGSLQTHVAKV
jgi:hypothetical protein